MEKDISLSRVLYINPTCAVEVRSFPLGSIIENDTLSPIGCVARHTRIHRSVSHDKGMGIFDFVRMWNWRTWKIQLFLCLTWHSVLARRIYFSSICACNKLVVDSLCCLMIQYHRGGVVVEFHLACWWSGYHPRSQQTLVVKTGSDSFTAIRSATGILGDDIFKGLTPVIIDVAR